MRRTKEEANETRRSLLEAALQVFSSKGYAATRLEDIAEVAHVSRGAIYHHFGGKAELFSALVVDASQLGDQAFERAISEGGTYLQICQRILIYTLKLLEEDVRYRETTALALFNSHDSDELTDFQNMSIQSGRETIEKVTDAFRMGLQEGSIQSDLDPTVLALAFLAYQNGLTMVYLSVPGSIHSTQVEQLANIFIEGIRS
jgi:TetR/AcrR family transcriptional regulator, acrAB operon repressor